MSKITIKNCRIETNKNILIDHITWEFTDGQTWLVIGPNGGGKAEFLNAISGDPALRIVPNAPSAENPGETSLYSSVFGNDVEIVSLERAARLIQEERENDESEYMEGGVDIGRTGRVFIAESLCGSIAKNAPLPKVALELDSRPEIKLCGIEKILDRGLKYMSTGEIRRTLLARALISGKKLLILSDPFAGLDKESRTILLKFFENYPSLIMGMERWHEIPSSITHVLEWKNKEISFCGPRADYEKLLEKRAMEKAATFEEVKTAFNSELAQTLNDTSVIRESVSSKESMLQSESPVLIEMNNVNVGWGDHHVLRNLTWKLRQGEHWLIRGPNGSGKTTFLELITGDNGQVYANDVRIFGVKRGSGESIWEIKQKLGIVSYRMHVEYRMLGGTSLKNVIVSGFRDSIGLYGAATDVEMTAALKWLKLGGFEGRENESFGALSYGEQRAILILRSAVKCPPILILDEPCHGLDEAYRDRILQLMEKIAETGDVTLLHVTHDPSEKLANEKHILELHPDEDPMYLIINE